MEQWRKVPGYENYEISIETKEGKCRSLNYRKTGIVRELSNKPSKTDGRIYWCLSNGEKAVWFQAARWIAMTFPELIENEYFDCAEIDHKDTVRLNNNPSNLRWVTRKQNLNNPLTREHNSKAQTGKNLGLRVNRKDLSKAVEQYSLDGTFINWYPSSMEAERQTGINHSHITKCCKGKAKTAGNKDEHYLWRYAM